MKRVTEINKHQLSDRYCSMIIFRKFFYKQRSQEAQDIPRQFMRLT